MGDIADFARAYIDAMKEEAIQKTEFKISNYATDAVKEVHDEIVKDWFASYGRSNSMQGTKVVHSNTVRKEDKLICTTKFYNDVDLYTPKPKADAWRARHSSIPSIPGQYYVFDLQMLQGIIGLPPYLKKDGSHYESGIPIQQPLSLYILSSSKWEKVIGKVLSKL